MLLEDIKISLKKRKKKELREKKNEQNLKYYLLTTNKHFFSSIFKKLLIQKEKLNFYFSYMLSAFFNYNLLFTTFLDFFS
jgi:hypothetical protein